MDNEAYFAKIIWGFGSMFNPAVDWTLIINVIRYDDQQLAAAPKTWFVTSGHEIGNKIELTGV